MRYRKTGTSFRPDIELVIRVTPLCNTDTKEQNIVVGAGRPMQQANHTTGTVSVASPTNKHTIERTKSTLLEKRIARPRAQLVQ